MKLFKRKKPELTRRYIPEDHIVKYYTLRDAGDHSHVQSYYLWKFIFTIFPDIGQETDISLRGTYIKPFIEYEENAVVSSGRTVKNAVPFVLKNKEPQQ